LYWRLLCTCGKRPFASTLNTQPRRALWGLLLDQQALSCSASSPVSQSPQLPPLYYIALVYPRGTEIKRLRDLPPGGVSAPTFFIANYKQNTFGLVRRPCVQHTSAFLEARSNSLEQGPNQESAQFLCDMLTFLLAFTIRFLRQ